MVIQTSGKKYEKAMVHNNTEYMAMQLKQQSKKKHHKSDKYTLHKSETYT